MAEDERCYGTPQQRELLKVIGGTPLWRDFFLTGGTCLSVFYLHHRVSHDLDFFTVRDIDLTDMAADAQALLRPERTVAASEHFFSCVVEGVKLDFVVDPLSGVEPRPVAVLDEVPISIDRLENIGPNKICALISRGAAKDAVDCYTLYRSSDSFRNDYGIARQREALLEDLLYVGERLHYLSESTPGILRELDQDLRIPIREEDLTIFYRRLGIELFQMGMGGDLST